MPDREGNESIEAGALDLGVTVRGLAAGQKLFGRYLLVSILGRGGMGVVWRAFDEHLDRDVALKFLPELMLHDSAVLDDLMREARRSLEVTHRNIVRIHDFVKDNHTACISMEYVDGETFSALRVQKPHRVFETHELPAWVSQCCEALEYAHTQAQVVHCDLKPANLMVNSKGELKITDFGIARSLSESVSMLTVTRRTSCTLVYMSPQQLDGERPTRLDDIYSLGATLYELLTSKPPFYSGNVDRQIHEKTVPGILARRTELGIPSESPVPREWDETIRACLAKNPAERPQSASELCELLNLGAKASQRVSVGAPVVTSQASTLRSRGVIVGIVLLIAAFAAFILYAASYRRMAPASDNAMQKATVTSASPPPSAASLPSPARTEAVDQPLHSKATSPPLQPLPTQSAARLKEKSEWTNSLGMRFQAVSGTTVAFSVWPTRVSDYQLFVKETGTHWPQPEFRQTADHPAVKVSWNDAEAFCAWLTGHERALRIIKPTQSYRLPTDLEWSIAVGLMNEQGETPEKRDSVLPGFPWGDQWPPPRGVGNYDPSLHTDDYQFTSPVGSFRQNAAGLFDMGGNVYQWCLDWMDGTHTKHVLRGASWADSERETLMSSSRYGSKPDAQYESYGFRCVLEPASPPEKARDAAPTADEQQARARASVALVVLNSRDFEALARLVHPIKGVRFSPIAHIRNSDLVFKSGKVATLESDSTKYEWGGYDDNPKTATEYFAQILRADFSKTPTVNINNDASGPGSDRDNAADFYPDALRIEYYIPGSVSNQLSWSALRIVLERYQTNWYIVGIIYASWTP